jgi:hypothetical protein
MKYTILLSFLFLLLSMFGLKAQTTNSYTYQELSHAFYTKQVDSIKKNWVCPVVYKNKDTQKKYKEIWDERVDFITSAIKGDNFVYEKETYNYISGIIDDLAKANPKLLPVKPLLLIDRSSAVNAYAVGGNIIAVNLGLILFAQSREEIALVIAHELSHNILNHADNSMKERAVWFTSDEYKNSLNAILDSKYERLTKLQKVFEGYSFDRSKHSRYHESDADSLGIVLLKNAKISFDAKIFLRLDSSDLEYRQPLKNDIASYFTKYNLTIDDAWTKKKTKGLSTRSYNFKDTTGIEDSLKTHPDCIERYAKTAVQTDIPGNKTGIPESIKEKATKMVIWNLFDNLNLTACLYRVLQEKDKGNTDEWYDFMVYNIFSGLYYSDKELNRFNAIGVIPKEYISKEYYQLQTMLEQMPRENLTQFCKTLGDASFWKKMPADASALKVMLTALNFENDANLDKKENVAAKDFMDDNPSSIYCEFAQHFRKK